VGSEMCIRDRCATAARVAAAHRTVLSRCWTDGATIEVEVTRAPAGPLGSLGRVTVRARAGPPGPR